MDSHSSLLETRTLRISAGGNLVIGIAGSLFAVITGSQAILLDGLFNLTYFATGLFTLKVASLVQQGDDENFPMGYGYFEPLINGFKGMLVLGLTVMATADAVQALFSGGRNISHGLASIYGLFAALACWTLAVVTHRGARRSNSPLIRADAENWAVNGAISTAVLLAFLCIFLIRNTRFALLVPYIDPSLVLIVSLISISVPVRMAWQAMMEMLNRAPSKAVVKEVTEIIKGSIGKLPVQDLIVRVVQPGRTRMVLAHVVLPDDYRIESLPMLDRLRADTLARLQAMRPATMIDLVFTSDPHWGALGSPSIQS
jgi:cation diffusion facilitator family transporter